MQSCFYILFYSVVVFLVVKDNADRDPRMSLTTLRLNIKDADDLPPVFDYRGCRLHDTGYSKICINASYTASVFSNQNVSYI